jgi:hypothetical protein
VAQILATLECFQIIIVVRGYDGNPAKNRVRKVPLVRVALAEKKVMMKIGWGRVAD